MRTILVAIVLAVSWLAPRAALATTITLSNVSSDATDPDLLDAEFDFSVSGATLTLTVSNTGSDFNINEVYFNASAGVTSLALTSATHSAAGNVSAAWLPIELGSSPDGFGAFDFGLTDGVGQNNPNIIGVGEDIVFVFSINGGVGVFTDADFIQENGSGYTAAAKFVNGPDDPEAPGEEDSAFGAAPEPGTLVLLGFGIAGLAALGRRAR
jgi:hypothetical protein